MSLSDMRLSTAVHNALNHANLKDPVLICSLNDEELYRVPGITKAGIAEIRTWQRINLKKSTSTFVKEHVEPFEYYRLNNGSLLCPFDSAMMRTRNVRVFTISGDPASIPFLVCPDCRKAFLYHDPEKADLSKFALIERKLKKVKLTVPSINLAPDAKISKGKVDVGMRVYSKTYGNGTIVQMA